MTNKNWAKSQTPWSPNNECFSRVQAALHNMRASAALRNFVERAMEQGPSRKVQSGRSNVLTQFPSQKNGAQLFLESRRGENPLTYIAERNPKVIAFFPQPPELQLTLTRRDRSVRAKVAYRADLMEITDDEVILRQVRDITELSAACLKDDYQWYMQGNTFQYRAANEAAAELGMRHVIVANSDIPSVLVRNLRFLEDYMSVECPPVDLKTAEAIANYVGARRFVDMRALINEAGFAADDVFKCIPLGAVDVDLETQLLEATDELVVYSDGPTRVAHQKVTAVSEASPLPVAGSAWIRVGGVITYDKVKYDVMLVGERDVQLRDRDGNETTMPLQALQNLHQANYIEADGLSSVGDVRQLADLSDRQLQDALRRLEALEQPQRSGFSKRQIGRFRKRTAACVTKLDKLLALSDHGKRGNFSPRHSEASVALMQAAIEELYNAPERPTKKAVFLNYIKRCEEASAEKDVRVDPVSYSRFCRACITFVDERKRSGKKSAYQKSRIVTYLDNAYPVHGARPHEVCHIDHTVATMALTSPNGMDLGKPTLTVCIDASVVKTRAMIFSFDPPSARLVLLVLRDYVRRWGRLPKVIVVDNGKEFHSAEFTFFCALYGIEIRYRPPGQPRAGSPVERLFGSIETELFSQLEGNTRIMRETRLVTADVNPFNRAKWTLPALHRVTEKFLFVDKPDQIAPALGMTPNEFEQQRLQETGSREHLLVRYDENLMLMTCPHAKKRLHSVCQRRGVWVAGMWYQHPELKGLGKGAKVEVRIEPWLHRLVYVHVKGKWVGATAGNTRWLGNKTRREVEVTLREEKRKGTADANRDTLSIKRAEAMEGVREPAQFDPRLQCQQQEMLELYAGISMTVAQAPKQPETIDVVATPADPHSDAVEHLDPATPMNSANDQGLPTVVLASLLPTPTGRSSSGDLQLPGYH